MKVNYADMKEAVLRITGYCAHKETIADLEGGTPVIPPKDHLALKKICKTILESFPEHTKQGA